MELIDVSIQKRDSRGQCLSEVDPKRRNLLVQLGSVGSVTQTWRPNLRAGLLVGIYRRGFIIPLEWSRIESGSLSPWSMVGFYSRLIFFSGWAPEIYFKTMFWLLLLCQGSRDIHYMMLLSLDPLGFILNLLKHHSGFYSGSFWQCFLMFFVGIVGVLAGSCGQKNQKIQRKIKKSSERCHNKFEFGVWPALDFLTFTIFTERSEIVKCNHGLALLLFWSWPKGFRVS